MFKKLDNLLINAAEKKKGKEISFLDRIFRNRLILILVSIVLIYRTVDHAISSYHHQHLILCGFYMLLVAILVLANIRHHFLIRR
ncbi:hypothetical protein EMGBS15_15300 [Filimonas sp.]|jgi:hypothetical protein|nr:hypothetical protein EMGBS15_15300 [Filimonas sp.]